MPAGKARGKRPKGAADLTRADGFQEFNNSVPNGVERNAPKMNRPSKEVHFDVRH